MYVDRDDGIAAGDLCRHQAGQPHGANPENDETVARARPHYVEHGAGTGLPAAGECTDMLEGGVVADLHGEALIGDGEIAERGRLEKGAVDRLAVLRMQCRTVGAGAVHLQIEGMQTITEPL